MILTPCELIILAFCIALVVLWVCTARDEDGWPQ